MASGCKRCCEISRRAVPTFPEFGADHERRLANLRILVERARKYGIGVYLYINEPRAMPASFFANRRGRCAACGRPS